MKVTVAICTWNRSVLLDKTLERFKSLRIPGGVRWELIIVDNASTDNTADIIKRHIEKLPIIQRLESKQGHCHARNCAIDHAEGEWILWTDDDVLVGADWLANYLAAIEQFPNAVFAGGTITPWFARQPPAWIRSNLGMLQGPFAIRELGPEVRWLDMKETVYGANMAFRTDVLRQNLFDPNFGLVGEGAIRGDEADVIRRIRMQGGKGLWVGNAQVDHYIPEERLTASYVRKFSFGYGQTIARQPTNGTVATSFGRPRWALRKYLQNRAMELVLMPFRNRRWLTYLQEAAICRGIMEQYRIDKAPDER